MFAVTLTVGTTWGCTDRPLEDDAATVCADACERDRRCGRPAEGEPSSACEPTCPSGVEKNRMDCQAFFDLQRCGSTLSCDDLSRYEDIVAQSDLELARTAVYPCNKENIAYLDECWDD